VSAAPWVLLPARIRRQQDLARAGVELPNSFLKRQLGVRSSAL
jgi:hypothetical protein